MADGLDTELVIETMKKCKDIWDTKCEFYHDKNVKYLNAVSRKNPKKKTRNMTLLLPQIHAVKGNHFKCFLTVNV
jgi:hypothetical protein